MKTTITGKSELANFIRKNIESIVSAKANILNPANGFLYLHKEGRLLEGNNQHFGHSSMAAFGGYEANETKAIAELQYLIDMDNTQDCPINNIESIEL